MTQFEKIWFSTFGIIALCSATYWGYAAWFRPEYLKNRLMKEAQRKPYWLFIKNGSLNYTEKFGVITIRLITLMVFLFVLVLGCFYFLKL